MHDGISDTIKIRQQQQRITALERMLHITHAQGSSGSINGTMTLPAATFFALAERSAALEQMCKDLHSVLYAAPLDLHERHTAWYERYDALEEQYYALFSKGTDKAKAKEVKG